MAIRQQQLDGYAVEFFFSKKNGEVVGVGWLGGEVVLDRALASLDLLNPDDDFVRVTMSSVSGVMARNLFELTLAGLRRARDNDEHFVSVGRPVVIPLQPGGDLPDQVPQGLVQVLKHIMGHEDATAVGQAMNMPPASAGQAHETDAQRLHDAYRTAVVKVLHPIFQPLLDFVPELPSRSLRNAVSRVYRQLVHHYVDMSFTAVGPEAAVSAAGEFRLDPDYDVKYLSGVSARTATLWKQALLQLLDSRPPGG
jgi:hypothetical protein